MATKRISLTIGTGATAVDLNIRGNLATYTDIAAVAGVGFTVVEATSETLAKTLNVITPEVALLESGSFKKLTAVGGKNKRTFFAPVSAITAINSAIESANGLTLDGVACTTVQQGNRRTPR
jgi:hypothetical protein